MLLVASAQGGYDMGFSSVRMLDQRFTSYPSGYSFESTTISATNRSVDCRISPLRVKADEDDLRRSRAVESEVTLTEAVRIRDGEGEAEGELIPEPDGLGERPRDGEAASSILLGLGVASGMGSVEGSLRRRVL